VTTSPGGRQFFFEDAQRPFGTGLVQVVRYQVLAMGAAQHLQAAVFGRGRDEGNPEIGHQGVAGFFGDEVGQVLVPGNHGWGVAGHVHAQGELRVGENFGADQGFGGV
jgi:hypothetical protein